MSVLPRSITDDLQWRILSFIINKPPIRRRCLAITKKNRVCKKSSQCYSLYCCNHNKKIIEAINSPYFIDSVIAHYNFLKRFAKKRNKKVKKKFITDYY